MTRRISFLLALVLLGCGGSQHADTTPEPAADTQASAPAPQPPPEGRLPADVRPTHYALDLAIDPREERFHGTARIDVTLPGAQRAIYLNAKGMNVTEATITPEGGEATAATFAMVDEERGLASVTLEEPVGPGAVTLALTYDAPFDQTLEGIYHVEQAGEHYAFSQMEPLSARKAFPCFDEPSFKTPFDVTLTVREGDVAIANAPETSAEDAGAEDAGEGMRHVHFATTPALPTYLVAFAVGPLDVVDGGTIPASSVRERPLPLRGVAAHGQGAHLAYAMEHTGAIVTALEDYFGRPYPYAKLDLIAVPDFAAGAMENAGAVTFRDVLLLLDDDAPLRQREGFAYVTAHELAHQWFGDLVTMAWWDDLWLNEAFATWMETRIIQATFPEYHPEVAQMRNVLHAMSSDSLASARQIRQPIGSDHDIHNAFDAITYQKGDAVLSMFETWLTPDVFQRGIQRYVEEHAGGNATAADLFTALSAEAGRDVRGPFTSFTDQPGVPLVEATPSCTDGTGSVALRQSRYTPLGSDADAESWQIPVCVRYAAGGQEHTQCTLLTEQEGAIELEHGCASWLMPNAGGHGYYRFTMPGEALASLREHGLDALDVREQMALADSIEASFDAGHTSFADALSALEPLARSEERSVASAPMHLIQLAIDHLLDEGGVTRARRHAATLYRAQARRLGWTPRADEDPETALWRAELLGFLAQVAEDPQVRREAARRGRAYLGEGGDGAIHPDAVSPDLAGVAVTVAVQEGGAALFNRVLGLLAETTDPAMRGRLVSALSAAREPALRQRALDLTLDERLRVNELFTPLMTQFGDAEGVDTAWTWLREHYDALAARMGPGRAGYLPFAASRFCSAEKAEEATQFFTPKVAHTEGGPRNLQSAVERVQLCGRLADHARESARAFFAH